MTKGKPGSSPLLRPDADAVSLHSTQGGYADASGSRGHHAAFLDEDAPELALDGDDLPPLYSDVVHESGEAPAAGPPSSPPANPGAPGARDFRYPAPQPGGPKKWRYDIVPYHPVIVDGPENRARHLEYDVRAWAAHPPRPYVQLRGTHMQTVENKGKKERREVVDFDVKVELTPYLYADARASRSWRVLRTADNRDRVRRGTVFPCQAPEVVAAAARRGVAAGDAATAEEAMEAADAAVGGVRPSLEDWCQRFCADPAPLRAFQLQRRMVGFDYDKVRRQMEALVRQTSYRGRLQVAFPVDEVGQVYYSDHRFNRWRLLRWVQVLCVLTLAIVVTWPYLFFRTRRYEVVTVEWPFSRCVDDNTRTEYVSLSEDQWYNLWARAIARGVLSRRQCTLNQEDLRVAEGAEDTFTSTGSSAVDGALGFVRAGISAMNNVNRQLGWGEDC